MLAAVEMIRSGTTSLYDMYGPDINVAEVVEISAWYPEGHHGFT